MRELIGQQLNAHDLAHALLQQALIADDQRPADDISILVLTISALDQSDDTRWLKVSMPLLNKEFDHVTSYRCVCLRPVRSG